MNVTRLAIAALLLAACNQDIDLGDRDASVTSDATIDSSTSACGDGVVGAGEACDTAIAAGTSGACPSSCDDGIACTRDRIAGEGCSARCMTTEIDTCTAGDACCPSGCNSTTDSDCSVRCGDGVVQEGETCDTAILAGRPGACPTSCNDGVACTTDQLVGSGCSASCATAEITTCGGGDGCCPTGCNAASDGDCSASCGDGIVQTGETCDTAIAAGSPGACPTSCSDGVSCTLDRLVGSGCSTSCSSTAITACDGSDGCCPSACNATTDSNCSPSCGNGVVEAPEICDTAITVGRPGACPTSCSDGVSCTLDRLVGSGCSASCSSTPITTCDGSDGCCPSACNATTDSNCSPSCGNGVVEAPEACDTAITSGPGACPTSCNDGMACTLDRLVGSGCSAACSATAITTCAHGDGCCPSACNAINDRDCSPRCGNGVVETPEICDTAIATGPGACPTMCNDGVACTIDTLEGTGCSAMCRFTPGTAPEIFGDGIDQDCDGYDWPAVGCPVSDALRVPGDYANISDAIAAIQTGTLSTVFICLSARTYRENIRTSLSRRSVYIYGVNAQATIIDGHIDIGATAGLGPTLEVAGVTITQGIETYNPHTYIHDSIVRGSMSELGVYVAGQSSLTLERCDVSAPSTVEAVQYLDGIGGTAYIRNNYIHGGSKGLAVYAYFNSSQVFVTGNTFVGNRTGIFGNEVPSGWVGTYSITYRDNVIVGSNQYGIDLGRAPIAHSNNALFDNAANYRGSAGPGAGYVSSDPMLDMTFTPPMPRAGSPLIGAASSMAEPNDFWELPRDTAPDIGAVERR